MDAFNASVARNTAAGFYHVESTAQWVSCQFAGVGKLATRVGNNGGNAD